MKGQGAAFMRTLHFKSNIIREVTGNQAMPAATSKLKSCSEWFVSCYFCAFKAGACPQVVTKCLFSSSIQAATAPASITIHSISRVITTMGARSLTLGPVLSWDSCYLFPSLDLLQKCKQQRLASQLPVESEELLEHVPLGGGFRSGSYMAHLTGRRD